MLVKYCHFKDLFFSIFEDSCLGAYAQPGILRNGSNVFAASSQNSFQIWLAILVDVRGTIFNLEIMNIRT